MTSFLASVCGRDCAWRQQRGMEKLAHTTDLKKQQPKTYLDGCGSLPAESCARLCKFLAYTHLLERL